MLLGQTNRSRVMECADQVMGGLGGRQADQRCRNHGCWLMHMDIPALKNGICCLV